MRFWPFCPKYGSQNFFFQVLPQLVVRHCYKLSSCVFKGKLMKHTKENGKKPNFGHDLGPFWPKFDSKIFFVVFTSIRSLTLLQAIILYNSKEN